MLVRVVGPFSKIMTAPRISKLDCHHSPDARLIGCMKLWGTSRL